MVGHDPAGPPTVAGGATHAGDVGADLTHEPKIVSRQFSCERDEQTGSVRLGHQPFEIPGSDQAAQTGPLLVPGVDQQAFRAGARRDVDKRGGPEARGTHRVAVRDGHHPCAFGLRATHRRRGQRCRAAAARDAGEPDLHKRCAPGGKGTRGAFDRGLIVRVPECRGDRARSGNDSANLAKDSRCDAAECAGVHVLRVDQIGATRERGRRVGRARHADQ